MNDLILYGGGPFANSVVNLENKNQQKNAIELIGSQYNSLKDFMEKLNLVLKECFLMNNTNTIENLMLSVSKSIPVIFNSEKSLLWIPDNVKNANVI